MQPPAGVAGHSRVVGRGVLKGLPIPTQQQAFLHGNRIGTAGNIIDERELADVFPLLSDQDRGTLLFYS
ncbi:MAG: hypothetical protein VX910_09235, partial [Candidatus Latescibacterota bacterium]|nr:hypothetical protein [Candidatus Latescibacterota bacterium]